jgi:hypothetical protein
MGRPTKNFHRLRQSACWLLIAFLAALPAPRSAAADGSVTVNTNFGGMTFADGNSLNPDTHVAVGPAHVVEVVNETIAFFNKTTGEKLFQQDLPQFFGDAALGPGGFDPSVTYDELAGRFVVVILQVAIDDRGALLYAVSNTSNPLDGFTEKHRIQMDEPAINVANTKAEPDSTSLGWNADAHVIAMTMLLSGPGEDCDHVAIIVIDKSTVLDADPSTFSFHHIDRSAAACGADQTIVPTMFPATMHGAAKSDPMWFLEETNKVNDGAVAKTQVRVTKMTNVLSATPTFASTDLTVNSYSLPPAGDQPGGPATIQTSDARFQTVAWRNNRLVATHHIGLPAGSPNQALARWYEFNTSGNAPTLTQQGTINPGAGVGTYYPAIEIAANGDLGMTFMQSSSSENLSVYVTGRSTSDAAGTMRTPTLLKAGTATYKASDCWNGSNFTQDCLMGDFSGIALDPSANDSFCAASEYATSAANPNWGTWIGFFTLGSGSSPAPPPVGHSFAVTSIKAKKSIKGGGGTLPVSVAVRNLSSHTETLDSSVLGDGVSTGLVRLDVEVVDTDGEECQPAAIALDGSKNAKLFSKGPKILKANGSLSVGFLVTYRCDAPLPKNKLSPDSGDYSHSAEVFPDEIDGITDSSASNSMVGLTLDVTP